MSEGLRTSANATVIIRSPDCRVAHLCAIARRRIEPRDVAAMVAAAAGPRRASPGPLIVTAPFLSPRTRELLAAAGASFLDGTGNIRLALERPAVFIEARGADKDPAREPRPLASLKGPAAARVVRALSDFRPPYGVRELARRCDTPAASVCRVITLLEGEAMLVRDDRGEVVKVDRTALLRRWTQDSHDSGSRSGDGD